MFDNKWQKKEMPLVSLIGMGGGIASPAFLASIVLNILKPTVFSPADDTGVPDFDYTAESSAITNVNQISGGWSSASFDSNGASNQWKSVAYGNGKYVALALIGNAYLAANSTDGINWTSYNTIPYTSYSHLAYGNGAFVAVGQNKIVYSTDEGESWSSASVASNWWKGVTYGDGKFVAVAEDGVNARVVISSDGINWTGIPDTDSSMWQAVTYGGGKFVAVSQMGGVMYSSDGMNWSTTSSTESAVWSSVAYGNGKFVAVGGTSTMYSADGINWFSGNNTVGYWQDITFGDGKFVAVSNYQDSSYPAAAGYSTDGDTWTPSNQAITTTWNGVDYVNGRFIAVAGIGTPKIMWSPTGIDEATELTLTDTTVSKVSDGSLVEGTSLDQVLTVGETVQADTTVATTVATPVFDVTTYTGTGSTMSISTGIDLTTKGLLWFSGRGGSGWSNTSHGHFLFDSERNNYGDYLNTSQGDRQMSFADYGWEPQPAADGTVSNLQANLIHNNINWVNWAFRAAPGFFDVVTYTGQYTWPNSFAVPHSLGSVPGMIIIKKISNTSGWTVWHKNLSSTTGKALDFLYTNPEDSHSGFFPTAPTSTEFYLGDNSNINQQNQSYVAYVFADTPGVIKCGTYTGTGSSQTINTGFKPKFVLTKSRSHSSDWYLMDSARPGKALYANQVQQDQTVPIGYVNNGFTVDGANFALNTSGYEYIYMAIAEDAEVDITSDIRASGTVSASTGNTVTLSDVSGTWSTGMKVQGTDSDTKDYPDPIKVEDVSFTSSAPTAEKNVNTWGDAVWEIATDENFTQNVQTATTTLSATGTQAGPSFTLERETGYYTRTKYTALGQESEWSDVTYFVTKGLPVYADDVFSTYLYEGNSTSGRTITNGIDLSGEGGLVWIKERTVNQNHMLIDTVRGAEKFLVSNSSQKEFNDNSSLTAFNNDGFTINNGNEVNHNSQDFVSWTFRKAPGFFDIVTYTGNGSSQTIAHSLGSQPGFIMVKRYSTSEDWICYHTSLGQNKGLELNGTFGEIPSAFWDYTQPTSTHFSVGSHGRTNSSGETYVAYIFAHDDARFGTNGDESIIKCGIYTGNASTDGPEIDLGFEPQFLLYKNIDQASSWEMIDTVRGMPNPGDHTSSNYMKLLRPNTSDSESTDFSTYPTPTGFKITNNGASNNGTNNQYVYMAIRRPHKPATVVSDVFAIDTGSSSSTIPTWDSGFTVDMSLFINTYGGHNRVFASRLTGVNYLSADTSTSEATDGSLVWDSNAGWGKDYNQNFYSYMFKRSPGFMDVVTYTGTNGSRDIPHNLGVVPEMVIHKHRTGNLSWSVYHKDVDVPGDRDWWEYGGAFNSPGAFVDQNYIPGTPTSTTYPLDNSWLNAGGFKNVLYLFATLPGISKVGSYTAAGAGAKAIDCGFANGAAFIIIKNASSSGDWYLLDSQRGINAYNESDSYTIINGTSGTQIGNVIGYKNTGFMVNGNSPLNNGSDKYIFFAVANP